MKKIKFFLSKVLFVFIFFSCSGGNEESDNLLYFEKVVIKDGSIIDLVHIKECKEFDASACFIRKEDKIDYIKEKSQVFCFCIYGPECDMLTAISYRNAKKWYEWDFAYNTDNHDESANIFAERIDTISQPYEVWFSETKDGHIKYHKDHQLYPVLLSE